MDLDYFSLLANGFHHIMRNCALKKLRKNHLQSEGKIDCVLRLEESILLKWPYYPRQSTDSMQSLSNY